MKKPPLSGGLLSMLYLVPISVPSMASAVSTTTPMFVATTVATIIVVTRPAVITDTFLAATPVPVACIPVSVIIKVIIGPGLIDDYFVSAVEIVPAVSSGQVGGKYPVAGIEVNKLPAWYVVVSFYIGQVIVVGLVIPYRSPLRLCSNVDTYTYLG